MVFHTMNRIGTVFFLVSAVSTAGAADAVNDPLKVVIERRCELITQRPPQEAAELRKLVSALGDDGRWPDVDYDDDAMNGWQPAEAFHRVRRLCQALATAGHPLHKDKKTEAAVFRVIGAETGTGPILVHECFKKPYAR